MEQNFHTPGPVQLAVELGSGRLTAIATDTDESVVQVVGPRADEFRVVQHGDRIAVAAPPGRFFGRGEAHEVTVTVPTGSGLSTKLGAAHAATSGTFGMMALKTGSGDIEFEKASGSVLVESGSGHVSGREISSDVRIKSGSGDVDLGEVGGRTSISTGSGDVALGVTRSTTVVKTGSGDLSVKRAEADVSLTTASGDLTVGWAAYGKVTAKNVSGDVRIGIPVGTPVWTDVSTVTGRLRSNLTGTGKPAEGQPHLELRATTVSGDVLLTQV